MKVKLIKIGFISSKEIKSLVNNYDKRLKSFCQHEFLELKDPDSKEMNLDKEKSKINQFILELKAKPGTFLVLLDERGKQLSSPGLANFIENKTNDPQTKNLVFVVGGAFGFSELARKQADFIWSLSEGVFPNEIAWLIVWEQIYRAYNILKGTPYHHA